MSGINEDQIKGGASELGGRVKDAIGGLTGDAHTQAEGKYDEVAGRMRRGYGDAKESLGDTIDDLQDQFRTVGEQLDDFMAERPLAALLTAGAVGYMLAALTRR